MLEDESEEHTFAHRHLHYHIYNEPECAKDGQEADEEARNAPCTDDADSMHDAVVYVADECVDAEHDWGFYLLGAELGNSEMVTSCNGLRGLQRLEPLLAGISMKPCKHTATDEG